MELTVWDGLAFGSFIALVISVSLYASRKEENSEDYFLAGRSLSWWLIGFSLIASNISAEHFVGMAGSGFGRAGLAIASYEWIAAVTLVFIGLVLLPIYLRLGIYTIPEFLEHRYGRPARTIMAVFMMVAYVSVAIAAVLYASAVGLKAIFGLNLYAGIWIIGILAGAYTVYGGLKAVVWSDLVQGVALLVGGAIVTGIALTKVGGLGAFLSANSDKLHVILPADHPDVPWTAMIFAIWIPNFFYWGFNQFITQRTLGAKSLAQGQLGIMFAALIKLIMPFIIVFPGILAFQLFGDQIASADQAYPVLIKHLVPAGLRGILFAALLGAVMSSVDSMLNSASTIFTIDIYKPYVNPDAGPETTIKVGRVATAAFCIAGCLLAPLPGRFEGVFNYIQMVWGFFSPGVVAVFAFGLIFRRAPLQAAVVAMLAGVPIYGGLLWLFPATAFLNHMATTFIIQTALMALITWRRPLAEPALLQAQSTIDINGSALAKKLGVVVLILTLALYAIFW